MMMKKIVWIIGVLSLSLSLMLFAQNRVAEESVAAEEEIFTPLASVVENVVPKASPEVIETSPQVSLEEEEEASENEFILGGSEPELAVENSGLVSFSFEDRPISEVITDFSLLSGANIITPDLGEEVLNKKTSITLNFDISEWKSSMQAVLSSQGLELFEEVPGSEIYLIRHKVAGALPPLEMEVFKLNFASVGSVTGLISKLIGTTGTSSVFPERNLVVVRGTAKSLQDVRDVLVLVDLPREQVFIEAKFLELTDRAQRDLGINWKVLQAYGVKAEGLGMRFTETESTTISDAQQRFYDIAGRTYEEGSGVTDEAARRGNLDPDHHRLSGLTPTRQVDDTFESTKTKSLAATLGADDFQLILSALEQNNGVSLVSNPKIIVANEEEATIHLGTKRPNIRKTKEQGTTDDPGGSVTVELDTEMPWFEDGVKVVVKPTINTAENITVEITPELTSFKEFIKVEDVEYPVIQVKTVETVFGLESGQTAAIGGLTQTEERNRNSKVPLLGSLPVLGRLFSFEQTIEEQTETIIFVTVGLANPADIDMETGLPTRTRLARDYNVREGLDLRMERETRNLLRAKKTAEAEDEEKRLQEIQEKFIADRETKRAEEEEARLKKEADEERKAEEKALRDAERTLQEETELKEREKENLLREQKNLDLEEELKQLRVEGEKIKAERAAALEKEKANLLRIQSDTSAEEELKKIQAEAEKLQAEKEAKSEKARARRLKEEEKARRAEADRAKEELAQKKKAEAKRLKAEAKARETAEKAEAKARKARQKQSEKEAKERAKNLETLRKQQEEKKNPDPDIEAVFKSLSM